MKLLLMHNPATAQVFRLRPFAESPRTLLFAIIETYYSALSFSVSVTSSIRLLTQPNASTCFVPSAEIRVVLDCAGRPAIWEVSWTVVPEGLELIDTVCVKPDEFVLEEQVEDVKL